MYVSGCFVGGYFVCGGKSAVPLPVTYSPQSLSTSATVRYLKTEKSVRIIMVLPLFKPCQKVQN
jgi:hypothetical protein